MTYGLLQKGIAKSDSMLDEELFSTVQMISYGYNKCTIFEIILPIEGSPPS
jgi:hypothetical protein